MGLMWVKQRTRRSIFFQKYDTICHNTKRAMMMFVSRLPAVFLAALVCATTMASTNGLHRTVVGPVRKVGVVKGDQTLNRRLHDSDKKKKSYKDSSEGEDGRDGDGDPFATAVASVEGAPIVVPSPTPQPTKKPKAPKPAPVSPAPVSNSNNNGGSNLNSGNNNSDNNNAASDTTSSVTSSLATTYDNKCAAAEAGEEFKTNTFVPVYYQYELVTSASRNVLQVADIIDKAVQHFLAVWLVDWCVYCFSSSLCWLYCTIVLLIISDSIGSDS